MSEKRDSWAHSRPFTHQQWNGWTAVCRSFSSNSETGVYSSCRPCATPLSVAGLYAFLHSFLPTQEEENVNVAHPSQPRKKRMSTLCTSLINPGRGEAHRCAHPSYTQGGGVHRCAHPFHTQGGYYSHRCTLFPPREETVLTAVHTFHTQGGDCSHRCTPSSHTQGGDY